MIGKNQMTIWKAIRVIVLHNFMLLLIVSESYVNNGSILISTQ